MNVHRAHHRSPPAVALTHTLRTGGIVINRKKEIILVSNQGKTWTFPKGHINRGETTLEGAKREIIEETGVRKLKCHAYLGWYHRRGNLDPSEEKTIHLFLFSTTQKSLKPQDKDNPFAGWYTIPAALHQLTSLKDKAMLRKVRKLIPTLLKHTYHPMKSEIIR